MTNEEAKKLPNGVYKIYWQKGHGKSVAAIGRDSQGNVWIQAANWVSTNAVIDYWQNVDRVEMIKQSKT